MKPQCQLCQSLQQKGFQKKNKKKVGGLSSGERRKHVAATICFSATGIYVPPLLIIPRKNSHPDYFVDKPREFEVMFHQSGYMQMEIFEQWMQIFINFVKPTAEERCTRWTYYSYEKLSCSKIS